MLHHRTTTSSSDRARPGCETSLFRCDASRVTLCFPGSPGSLTRARSTSSWSDWIATEQAVAVAPGARSAQRITGALGQGRRRCGGLARIDEDVAFRRDRLPEFAGEVFDFHAAHPELARLLVSKALSYGGSPFPGPGGARCAPGEEGQARARGAGAGGHRSVLRPGRPAHVHRRPRDLADRRTQVARQFLGGGPDAPEVRARYRARLVEAIRRIITPPAQHDR